MIGTPVKVVIRAIPRGSGFFNGPGEQYFDLTDVPWADQQAIRKELDEQGFYVQEIYFSDPMPLQIGVEIRKRIEAEKKGGK